MSSFDKTAGKNLDEILASIRKTLADETPHPEMSAVESNSPSERKVSASVQHNGSKAQADKIDEDLADLLAGGLGMTAPAPGPKDAPDATADQRDPLWFLRPRAEGEAQVLPLPADRVSPSLRAQADAAVAPEPSSLAPAFVSDNGRESTEPTPAATGLTSPPLQASAAPAAASAAETKSAAKGSAQDAVTPAGGAPLPEVAGLPGSADSKAPPAASPAASAPKTDPAKPGAAAASAPAAIAAPLKPQGPTQPGAAATAPDPVRPAEPGKPAIAAAGAPLRAGLGQSVGSPSKAASVTPHASALNGAASMVAPPAAASPTHAATMVPTAQTHALEQIIEQLLEPLLRRWVEANLPRLVDAAIRAEVARALDGKRLNGQDANRKG